MGDQITTTSNGEDQRKSGERIPIQLLVDYQCNGNYLFDFCRDLGVGGIFLETRTPPAQGTTIELTFTIPDSKETLTAKGKVIWVQRVVEGRDDLTPGIGVQFEADSQQHKTLEAFVLRYSKTKKQVPEAS